MIIVSYQNAGILDSLERDGYACCKSPEYALDERQIMFAYRWMAGKMMELLGPPGHDGVEFPMWGWAQQGCSRKEIRPRTIDFSSKARQMVMLTMDIPEDRLLLSDFDDWHAPLNQAPLYPLDRSGRKLQRYIDGFNMKPGTLLEDYPEELRRRIVESWDLIFNLGQYGRGVRKRRNRTIQATFWEIRKEWINGVRILDAKAFCLTQ